MRLSGLVNGGRGVFWALVAMVLLAPAASAEQQQASGAQQQEEAATPPQRVETVTVTATRLPTRLAEMPTAVVVFSGAELQRTPALTLDDALRWTPSFSLFRRTPSRAAHPTAQGANLRGIGPSGVSRSLVLVDGVPMNDPFGGWVYWDRVPILAVDRVEVAPGGGSAPWGSQALGGVLQLTTRSARRTGLELQALFGEQGTVRASGSAGLTGASMGLVASAELFRTDGYIATASAERGTVDTEVASSHQSARFRFDLRSRLSVTLEGLAEDRDNGTPLQTNETSLGGVGAAWQGAGSATRGWSVNGFARSQRFDSNFSSVAADRNSENLVLEQRVPSTDVGAGAQAWWWLDEPVTLSVGGDWRRVAGHSKERVVVIDLRRAPGGRQHLGGAYAAVNWSPQSRWNLSLAVRADGWHQQPVETPGPARGSITLSPRAGFVWSASPQLTLRGAAYRAFRAPTLNELYRNFRVGNVLTLANSELDKEHLVGGELGVRWSHELASSDARLDLESTFYWSRLEDAVINATESVSDELITRRRRNLGAATARGLELAAELTSGTWEAQVALSWLSAEISDTGDASTSGLDGNRVPQVPEYRARAQIRYVRPEGWSALLAVGAVGQQFEDDLNRLPLASAATVDASFDLPLRGDLALNVRGENLLDAEVPDKRTPTLSLGPPRLVYAGLRWNFMRAER